MSTRDEILPKDQLISIKVSHARVEQVLAEILNKTGLAWQKLSENLIVITQPTGTGEEKPLFAQKVSGKVTNDKGETPQWRQHPGKRLQQRHDDGGGTAPIR